MAEARTTIMWFRRDLRVADHAALSAAAARGNVVSLFVVDPHLLARRHHQAPARVAFLRAALAGLDDDLAALGGRLVIRCGDPVNTVCAVAAEVGADQVVVTREISPYGRARDTQARAALSAAGVEFVEYDTDLLLAPEQLPGPDGNGYRVFTPFYRAWRRQQILPDPIPAPALGGPVPESDAFPEPEADALPPVMPARATAAHDVIDTFVRNNADYYRDERDLVADDTTSHLSQYLRFGICSPAQVGRALGLPEPLDWGPDAFWRQIAWREFMHHLLYRRPEAATRALQAKYTDIRWDNDPHHIAAWSQGLTGYPLVDAAMRQLVTQGWVHNRARMVAASFLVKDLLVDWRIGERIFMQHLVDGDPANNNGGWQWVAGTGSDAAPYFRVLNPIRQAKKFDPEGIYVKRHVPELRRVPEEHIHEPWLMDPEMQRRLSCRIGTDYPAPIVDHAERRVIVLERYREAAARFEQTRPHDVAGRDTLRDE